MNKHTPNRSRSYDVETKSAARRRKSAVSSAITERGRILSRRQFFFAIGGLAWRRNCRVHRSRMGGLSAVISNQLGKQYFSHRNRAFDFTAWDNLITDTSPEATGPFKKRLGKPLCRSSRRKDNLHLFAVELARDRVVMRVSKVGATSFRKCVVFQRRIAGHGVVVPGRAGRAGLRRGGVPGRSVSPAGTALGNAAGSTV